MMSTIAPPAAAAPADLQVRLDPNVRVLEHGCLLLGGTPSRLVRLQPSAAFLVAAWHRGAAIGDQPGARALARRLLDAGMLVPDPALAPGAELVVVVPAHGRTQSLARCLAAVRRTAPDVALLVVDDGSPDPAAIEAVCAAHDAEVTRHPRPLGPSAARNTGLAQTVAPLVAFVDSDVVVTDGCLVRLAGHFLDPRAGAVAPRVRSEPGGRSAIASYEARHSSLDMGPRPGPVRPRSAVPYVPSATLVVRRAAAGVGFNETREIGEDVDLVWRMAKGGWGVWYDPAATVEHELRTSARELAARRFIYATSIGQLAAEHPEALPALRVDAATGVVTLLLLRRPRLAAALTFILAMRIHATLRPRTSQAARLSAMLCAQSLLRAIRSLSYAVRRPWSPVCALAAIRSRRAALLIASAWIVGWTESRPTRPAHAALGITDDLISGIGTWWSCLHYRTTIPLRPSRG